MLLAIDTSAGTSVAVVDRDAGVLAEASSDDTRRHAEVIGELIDAVLRESGVAVTALSGVATGMGPGPFTGLRVGIAAARAFALAAGKPVVPIVSHDAIAFGAILLGASGPTLVATDARRNELYWSTYSGPDAAGLPLRTSGPSLVKAAELTTDGYTLLQPGTVSAADLGLLAESLYANGRSFADAFGGQVEPLYLRSPDVTLSAGPKRVTG